MAARTSYQACVVDARPWLLDGERVLWEGAPPRGLLLYRHDAELIPEAATAVAAGTVLTIITWYLPSSHVDWIARAFSALFLSLGLYGILGRFLVDAWVRHRQHYYVTDRRIFVVRPGWRGRVIAADLADLSFIKSIHGARGLGEIRFAPPRYRRSKSGRLIERDRFVPSLDPRPRFLGVTNVVGLDALIERAAAAARSADHKRVV